MTSFIMNNIYSLFSILPQECGLLGEGVQAILTQLYRLVEIATPIITILLITVDMVRAVIAQDDGEMEKAQSRSVKRLIIGLAIFLVPTILDALLKLGGLAAGICGVGK